MKSTKAHDYGIILMIALAKQWYISSDIVRKKGVFMARSIFCAQTGVPSPFMSKIAQLLQAKNLIAIRQGSAGGFVLTKNPEEISLYDVYVACNLGEISIMPCVKIDGECVAQKNCDVRTMWTMVNKGIEDIMKGIKFSDIAATSNLPNLKKD